MQFDTDAQAIFEAVDNMSQRERDHLKGRECHPGDDCEACDKIRAYFTALEEEAEVRNIYSNLQRNPMRDHSTREDHRHWQKRSSKQTTLRSHRPRK
jgi:hypothetical protein